MISALYVDDEPTLLEIGKLFLERSGDITVETEISAPAALQRIASGSFDAVVSDYQMPVMDGIGLLKMVRTSGSRIPFIIFTGRGREEVVIEALNEGADFYLQKGGEPKSQFAELAHKIRQAVEKRRAEEEVHRKNEELGAAFEELTAIEEELRQSFDDLSISRKQLLESQHRLADIINFLPDATFAVDREGTVMVWNRAIEELTGIPASGMVGKGNYEYALPLYGDRRPILIDLALHPYGQAVPYYMTLERKGDTIEGETKQAYVRGRNAILWGRASPLYDRDGRCIGAIETIRDVTEKRLTEQALAESESRYRNVVEAQTEFITRFAPDGTHVFTNEAYCRYFGLTADDLIGRRFAPEIPAEDRQRVREHFKSITPEHPVADIDHRIVMPDGEVRWQRWSDRGIFDDRSRCIEYQSVGRDITETKAVEQALRESEVQVRRKLEAILSPDGDTSLLELSDIIDSSALQALMDDLYRLTGIGVAVIDMSGRVLVGTGLQDICIQFHRVHPETCKNCIESNTALSEGVLPGEFRVYRCKNNLREIVTPIIVDKNHVGNLFLGQFLFEDEKPNYERFVRHAQQYGFDEQAYLAALDKVPRLNRETAAEAMRFLARLAMLISNLSHSAVRLARAVSERDALVGSLRESEERLQILMSNLPGMAYRCRVAWGAAMEFVSEGCSAVTGYEPEELMGGSVVYDEIIHPDDRDFVYTATRDCQGTGNRFRLEYRIITKQGEEKWVWEQGQLLPGYEHDEQRVEGFIMDITDRKEAEDGLRESEGMMRSIFRAAPIGMGVVADRVFTEVNQQLCDMLGYTRDMLIGQSSRMIYPDDAEYEYVGREKYAQIDRMGTGTVETRLRRSDGSVIEVVLSSTRIDAADPYSGVTFTILDITDRKEAERVLRTAHGYTRSLIEASLDPFVTIDPAGMITDVNAATERVTGYSRDALVGTDFSAYFTKPAKAREGCREVFRTGQVRDYPLEIQHRDGHVTPVLYNASVYRDESGEVAGVFAAARDISEIRRARRSLREVNAKLNLMSDITRHDILNQLTILSANLMFAREYPLEEPFSGYLASMDSAARTIQRQIEFARDYQNLGVRSPEWCSLKQLVQGVASSSLPIEDRTDGLMIYADPLLATVFANLMDNTLRHGESATRIRVSHSSGDNGARIVTWEDDGIGIPPGDKDRIFNRGIGKNTGLGLFLIREILAITGMTIRETGECGQGARFEITVPADAWKLDAR